MPGRDRRKARNPLLPALPLVAGALLLGCGDDDSAGSTATPPSAADGLMVIVQPRQATPGSTVTASVRNDTDRGFTYGADYGLEREVDGGFEPVDLPDRPIIEIAYIAKPGETGPPVEVMLPADLEPGSYRVIVAPGFPDGELRGDLEVSDGA